MKREGFIVTVTLAALGALVLACPPAGTIVIETDAGLLLHDAAPDATVTTCQTACDSMTRVGCAQPADCARVLCAMNADPRFPHYDLDCINRALVPSDVAKCGVRCISDP